MNPTLEERLRRLEDILAIQQLFIDYGLALDAGDLDTNAQLLRPKEPSTLARLVEPLVALKSRH